MMLIWFKVATITIAIGLIPYLVYNIGTIYEHFKKKDYPLACLFFLIEMFLLWQVVWRIVLPYTF